MTQALDPSDLPDPIDDIIAEILREPDDDILTDILRKQEGDEALLDAIDRGIMPRTDYSRLKINPDDTERMFRLITGGLEDAKTEDEVTTPQP